jgi:oligoribonuclease (3'-5' exoribonuclease)
MMEDSVFGILYRRISECRQALADYMVNGGPPDYVAYVKAQAQHTAYVDIEEDIKELEKRFMEQ